MESHIFLGVKCMITKTPIVGELIRLQGKYTNHEIMVKDQVLINFLFYLIKNNKLKNACE